MKSWLKNSKRKVLFGVTIIIVFATLGLAFPGPGQNGFPILMYHQIGYESDNPLVIPPEQFEQQMKYLYESDFKTISSGQLNDYLRKHKSLPRKPILVTFDDGNVSVVQKAMPILKKYKFKGTAFVIGKNIGHGGLSGSDIRELDNAGWDIGNHTFNHAHLGTISKGEQLVELDLANAEIHSIMPSKRIEYFSYPTGSYNLESIESLKSRGFLLAFTTDPGWVKPDTNPYLIPRIAIGPKTSQIEFMIKVNSPYYPRRIKLKNHR